MISNLWKSGPKPRRQVKFIFKNYVNPQLFLQSQVWTNWNNLLIYTVKQITSQFLCKHKPLSKINEGNNCIDW